ncbi:CDP-glycerol glycerophosphotransferase family protein [Aliarcobacter butzleri]|nr:CDP-glycerol glycerophosphotransferase family protein [Aliarcobacter butzleri]MCG3714074.1 CDP-glycerol glycerophosphotransferase family protein [Aliarcobacter butzleri]MCT7562651.1 CDP-glycerol glycerophosphotransferase family protein [Aliarcobacter butzleri]
MTLSLESYLIEQNIISKGFIDKNKIDTNITQIEKISNTEFDYIFILSPNHFEAIAQEYLNYIPKDKIIKVTIENAKYSFSSDFSNTKKEFLYIPKDIEFDRKKVVFISKGFISANNKALYLHCIKNKIDTIILTNNKEQIEELKQSNLPYQILDTKESDYEIATAKYIVFDQGNYTYLPPLHHTQKTIQLWHGVGLKKMSKMCNITYDYFISTSSWTNETNFKNIFQAKSFLNLGYARNDIFFRQEDDLDLIFCDRKIYEIIKNSQKKVILYMPTHRENRSSLELDFEKLNQNLQKIDAIFIVKIHPMVLEYYKTIQTKEYSNIFFHNGYGDIYPLLKYVDILVSDYSSIIYDFLLLNKPIIFYIYDIEEYKKNVQLLFDYDEFSPGIKVKTQEKLENAFLEEDKYIEKREAIKNLFFDKIAQNISSKNIIDTILKEK